MCLEIHFPQPLDCTSSGGRGKCANLKSQNADGRSPGSGDDGYGDWKGEPCRSRINNPLFI